MIPVLPGDDGPDFRFLFEKSPALYLILRPDYTILAVTDAYARATLTTRETLLGRGLFEVFPDNPDNPNATGTRNLRESLERAVATRAPDSMAVQKYDIQVSRGTEGGALPESEGGAFEIRYWSPVNTPLFGPDGSLACIVHRVEDVTEFVGIKQRESDQKKAADALRIRAGEMELEVFQRAQELQEANRSLRAINRELAAAKKRAEDSSRDLEAFSYSVSHDLRAPLQSIDGFSMLLLSRFSAALDPVAQGYLARVRASAQRMARLIDELLELARVSHSQLVSDAVDLSAIAETVAGELRETAPQRKAEFRVQPGIMAKGDARLLRIVMENLLGNAFKFTGKTTEPLIEFGAAREDGRDVFCVRDNGAGFDPRYADKLFGTFQRLHSVQEFEGMGIGLATVRRIIGRHGGEAWARSQVGQGASFFFTLQGKPGET